MSISCGSREAKTGYVEVYSAWLIRTVRRLSARRDRMASEMSVPPRGCAWRLIRRWMWNPRGA